jgi:hypothetical protein
LGIPQKRVRLPVSPWAQAFANAFALGVLVLAAFFIWYPNHVRQAEYDRLLREGVAATALVDQAYTRQNGDHTRHILVVRYYTDGTPGPPHRSSWSMFPDFRNMPEMMMGKMPPPPEPRLPPMAFDVETSMENGRITMRPVSSGEKAVPAQFYDDHPEGSTVEVRYLPTDSTKFILIGTRPGAQSWVTWTMIGIIGLMACWRFWRMYVR